MRLCAVAAVLAVCACAGPGLPPATGMLVDLPGDGPADRAVSRARQLSERGRFQDALDIVGRVLREDPRHVDGLRLRQDLLRTRGRVGVLRCEIEAMLRADPQDPLAHYLLGRIVVGDASKEQCFRSALDRAPDSFWPWLGLAFALRERDPQRSLEIYARLSRSASGHPVVAVAEAAARRQAGDYEGALRIYQAMRGATDAPGVGDLGVAQTLLQMDKRRESWAPMLAALRVRPFDAGLRNMVREWLAAGVPDDLMEQILDVLAEDPARMREFGEGDGLPVLASLLMRVQRPHAARDLLESVESARRTPAQRRMLARAQLGTGDVAAFVASLGQTLPEPLLQDETNQVRGLWIALLTGPWHTGDPLQSGAQSLALATALRDCGLLQEAAEVSALAGRRWPESRADLERVRDEVLRELSFEGALRRLLYQRYASHDTPPLDRVLEDIRQVSRLVLGDDVVGEVRRFQAPLVGEMLDPFASGLCQHLQRYNKHLVLGRRSGGVVEGMLLTRLSVRELAEDEDLPLPARCFEVIGEHREIRSLSGVMGGDLAGVALLNHYVIDLDAVREWAQGIAERRRIVREDGGALLEDPLPAQVGELEPIDVAWRLAALSPLEDSGLDLAVLEMIRHHERAHLVDSFHYLPFENNLFRVLGLLFSFLFSGDAIEAEMERRAELAAVALSSHPQLSLAHVADFLEAQGESPHAHGFRRLAADLAGELPRLGLPPADSAPHRWHLLPPAMLREAARELLRRAR